MGAGNGGCEDRGCGKGGCEEEDRGLFRVREEIADNQKSTSSVSSSFPRPTHHYTHQCTNKCMHSFETRASCVRSPNVSTSQ